MHRMLLLLFFLYSVTTTAQNNKPAFRYSRQAIVSGDSTKKQIALVFTADEFGEGLPTIIRTLKKEKVKASFFFTGRFYRNDSFKRSITQLHSDGHYLGPHSDGHLLYCDWKNRDSLLVTKDSFEKDMLGNQHAMLQLRLPPYKQTFFIPPFEWWNDSIAIWSRQMNLVLFSFTPGIRTAVDYTWPQLDSYKNSDWIVNHVNGIAKAKPQVLNGAIILIHAGTDPRRKDKLYNRLEELIGSFRQKGYSFKRIDKLLDK